jgi:hypothetical protein
MTTQDMVRTHHAVYHHQLPFLAPSHIVLVILQQAVLQREEAPLPRLWSKKCVCVLAVSVVKEIVRCAARRSAASTAGG